MNILEFIKTNRAYFDGGTGTILQAEGLELGETPENWNLTNPNAIINLHNRYLKAGANIIKTNTFGVNCRKYSNYADYIKAAFDCAKQSIIGKKDVFIAFDMGPLGRLLKPLGDLDFEDAVEIFAVNVKEAVKNGADAILIETMNDLYETKAAVIASKENSNLPIFVTCAYGEDGKLMTGADAKTVIATLEALGCDAIGLNCSFGPDKMIPILDEYAKLCRLPIIANPNAGLPSVKDGRTFFDIDAEQFSEIMVKIAQLGVGIMGGCCGTTPDHIAETIKKTKSIPLLKRNICERTVISSYTHTVEFGNCPILIGERINPTGKKHIKEALRCNDYTYILSEGVKQVEAGVQVLDVNAGLPEIDEAQALCSLTFGLQSVTDAPLQLDSSNPKALESAMRIYNGKPFVNSVTGTQDSMAAVFPLIKKYGGTVIALTLDENGIPETAEGRFAIAEKIVNEAAKYGISKSEIIVDPLCMTVSSNPKSAIVTLEAIKLIKENLGVSTSLGVSNISFGLPKRGIINSSFFTAALYAGLDAAIMNPFSAEIMDSYYAFRALTDRDKNFTDYISYAETIADTPKRIMNSTTKTEKNSELTLSKAIIKGFTDAARDITVKLLENTNPMELINTEIISALNEIGTAFEQKKAYLPQLLISAEAASAAFNVIKEKMPSTADRSHKIVIATVKGDIHDIGKNIVKTLLENYGFFVEDLGKDVDPSVVAQASKGTKLVGLSALMTTTVPSMEETIKQIRRISPETKIVVGGAVLTQSYADMIGADYYCKDAMDTVRIAQSIFEEK